MSRPIEDYAMIGDGHTVALVARDGGIDWLCWPRFDSDACFAALLGTADNGRWHIGPTEAGAEVTRRYRPDTLVLDTELRTAAGAARLTDFMPVQGQKGASAVVRLVECVSGTVELEFDIRARFDYGQIKPWIRSGDGAITGVIGPDLLVLRSDLELDASHEGVRRRFTLRQGESQVFTLQYGTSDAAPPAPLDPQAALRETEAYWRDWIGRFDKPTRWPEAVRRSLLTLKALMYQPSGGLVAAPTLGLPEQPRGKMNWDYRYCWLRDSTFTLVTLLNAGYHEQAREWLH